MLVILAGGPSAEREVSFATAKTIQDSLQRQGVKFVVIDPAKPTWLEELVAAKPEKVVLALHGTFGEDGKVQHILQENNLPHTGSGATVSALAFDKLRTKDLVASLGVAVPKTLSANDSLNFPVVVKPNKQGSSYGVSIVSKASELSVALELAQKYDEDSKFIIEELIPGTELTCGVIDVFGSLQALPLVEIVPKASFFDYQAKYSNESGCEEICPARIEAKLTEEIQEKSVSIYKKMGARSYGRLDWILRDGQPYFLEINTLPGMTPTSLINKELSAAGINFDDFIRNLLASAR